MRIRIGSRGSKLAVTQAEWVGKKLMAANPGLEIDYVRITTTGDKEVDAKVLSIGGKGIFVKEIEEALLRKEIDLAVHSLKDVPQDLPSGLIIGPSPLREDPRDVLISRFGEQLNELPKRSILGTGSPRRQAQINFKFKKRLYRFEPLRGNIETRLKKLKEGRCDAIVLAHAGLRRLGLESEVTQILETDELMPAPGQGCLGLEVRDDEERILQLLESIKDANSDRTARAERAFLQGLGGNCFVPVGVSCRIAGDRLEMKALLFDPKGEKSVQADQAGAQEEPELVGGQLAERLLANGGSALLIESESTSNL